MILFWSLTFTITYGLRAVYTFVYSDNYLYFKKFFGYELNEIVILLWDLPALVSTFYLNWQMLKEFKLKTKNELE
jgi:hypothetical protein